MCNSSITPGRPRRRGVSEVERLLVPEKNISGECLYEDVHSLGLCGNEFHVKGLLCNKLIDKMKVVLDLLHFCLDHWVFYHKEGRFAIC